ncbi:MULTISPECIES: glycoside hydrolase family 53 protein [unclassified Agarivorans]|uniref:glycoside hydrolase family 53 protein n=1 Tax=unclassified Agarivorans TaxID=2636026 RepID=UPI003D7C4371
MQIGKQFYWLVVVLASLFLVACGSSSTEEAARCEVDFGELSIPVPSLHSGFIKGADVSYVPSVEAHGGKYFDNCVQTDPLAIMQQHGLNAIRMRVWVDPFNQDGEAYGGGTSTLAQAIDMGKRAHALGMQYLLDIHYSDFWADPGHQTMPKAWKDLDYSQLVAKVGSYTTEVMAAHRAAGVMPDMVQVGNETNSGMLWPYGYIWKAGWDQTLSLFDAGANAVRAAYQQDETVKIILHIANPQNQIDWWFKEAVAYGIDFDIMGVSYYPYWHGSLSNLKSVLEAGISETGKPVMVVETAYAFTLDNGDDLENTFTASNLVDGYEASIEGQAKFLADLMNMLDTLDKQQGLGMFYWEPAVLPVKGVTWATAAGMEYNNDVWYEGNNWDNQNMFDFEGNVLPSIDVFSGQ